MYETITFFYTRFSQFHKSAGAWEFAPVLLQRNCNFDYLEAQHIFAKPSFSRAPFDLGQIAKSFGILLGKDADWCNLKRGCLFLFARPISLLLYYTNHIELLMLHGEMSALELWPFSVGPLFASAAARAIEFFYITTTAWRWPAFCFLSFCDNVDNQGAVFKFCVQSGSYASHLPVADVKDDLGWLINFRRAPSISKRRN